MALILLLLIPTFLFTNFVKADNYDLMINVTCPSRVYSGEPFNFQVLIHNNSTTTSHNYTLFWEIDGDNDSRVTNFGSLKPDESITITSGYIILVHPGAHLISISFFEDETEAYSNAFLIEVISIKATLTYSLTPIPVYPGSKFNLTLGLKNNGQDRIYNATIRVLPIKNAEKEIEFSPTTANLGDIIAGSTKSVNIIFNVAANANPAIYNIPIYIYFFDKRGLFYEEYYYIPFEVSSREIKDRLELIETKLENYFNSLKNYINQLQKNLMLITIVIVICIVITGAANYLYIKRTKRTFVR
jgi:hypothetical protein